MVSIHDSTELRVKVRLWKFQNECRYIPYNYNNHTNALIIKVSGSN